MAESKFTQGVITISSLKNPQKYVGKLKDQIVFRSSWEFFFLKFADRNPNILEWKSEETVVQYIHPLDHRPHRYFLDFWIRYRNKQDKIKEAIIEIKPYSETIKPVLTDGMSKKSKEYVIQTWLVNQAKWQAAKDYAYKRGIKFDIITEKELKI